MEQNIKNKLIAADIDVDEALERMMGNEEIYIRFTKKFLDDGNYKAMKEALENKDYVEAFKCVHTLRGVTGNLSMMGIYRQTQELTELLRNRTNENIDDNTINKINEAISKIDDSYKLVVQTISEI